MAARNIKGELIIIHVASDIGDMEDEIYILDETGRAVWSNPDGKTRPGKVTETLKAEFERKPGEIEKDV